MAGRQAVKAYLDLVSQACRAILIFLKDNKIPHTVENIAIRKGEQKTPEFTKLNPMQKLPVLVDNGFVLTESDAILKYLATAYNVPDHWYPKLPEKRARVDEYTAWNHANTRTHISSVFLHEVGFDVLLPRMGQQTNPEKLEKALADLDGTLDKLENMFLKNQAFLCGDDISLADLLAVCELMQPLCGGRDILKDRPKLLSWRRRVQSALSDSFDEAHSVVYQIREKFTAKLSPCSKQATL
ncbi:glutathione S-transferase theta-1-like [Carassius carassius]|uniref:glutathione S-transferase theta-1-like n=1 Tax=Carassius carassius TaxID=217509 RepID=UPI002868A054|nr:glutathione S-transferase theta-1-like [Carassius carassius]